MSRCSSIKDKLRRYKYMDDEVIQLKREIEELREKATSIRGAQFDEIPCHANSNNDKIGKVISKLVDMENMYIEKIWEITEEQKRLEEMIDSLPENERIIIRKKYKEGKTLEKICVEMNYSWRHITRLHGEALNRLREKEDNKTEKTE